MPIPLARSSAAALLAAGVCLAGGPAAAAPPNIDKYCKTHFPGGYVPTSPVHTPHFCFKTIPGRGSIRHIDFAVACQMTTGSPDFHYVDGMKIECGKKPRVYVPQGAGVYILQAADLVKYCEKAAGPGARPSHSASLKRPVCAGADTPGPKPLTINFAIACSLVLSAPRVKVRHVRDGEYHYVACLK